MEGGLRTFTFLDPTDNLLAWSEKFDAAAWQKDPLLQIATGIADPQGGSAAFHVTNPAGAPLRLRQTLNVPGLLLLAERLARSGQMDGITLLRGGETAMRAVDQEWRRLVFASASSSNEEAVAFGVEIAPGASLELFGLQVEAQIGASFYKKTASRGGAYPATRFADDGLVLTTIGPGRHGCVVHLTSH